MPLDLKSKLARLDAASQRRAVPASEPLEPDERAKRERLERVRGLIAQLESRTRAAVRAAGPRTTRTPSPLPGETIETAHGALHRVAKHLLPDHCHGRIAIARALEARGEDAAALALDPTLAAIDLRRMLLIDTETTGLSGGTGTLPFLIGMAWFEDESLRVEQLFLRRPGEERPMLARLAERVAASSCIVSYNGKAFDWPLLRTRAVMNRVALPTPAAHLDLLHCARRVFARRMGQVRLVHVETDVLGMRRERDVDGSEIPHLYWDFVRGHDGSVIAPVIEHNANDLVALAALLAVLAERWRDALPAHEPADRLGIAKIALRHGDLDRAAHFARAAAGAGGSDDVTIDALLVASTVARSRSRDGEVTRILLEALALSGRDRARAGEIHLALAKHLEHRGRDPETAIVHARHTAAIEGEAACAKRVARLLGKHERRGAATAKKAATAARKTAAAAIGATEKAAKTIRGEKRAPRRLLDARSAGHLPLA